MTKILIAILFLLSCSCKKQQVFSEHEIPEIIRNTSI